MSVAHFAPTGVGKTTCPDPGALPLAFTFRPVGAVNLRLAVVGCTNTRRTASHRSVFRSRVLYNVNILAEAA